MIVLGLDPSLTNFGWALFESSTGQCLDRGRIKTKPKDFDDDIDRYLYIRRELANLIQSINPDRMGTEHAVFNSSQSPAMYALFMNTMESVKYARKDIVLWSPTQLKSLARTLVVRPPKWKMEKADMIEAAQKATGVKEKWNDNEADAFLVAKFSCRWWQYRDGILARESLIPEEYHAFAEIKKKKNGKVVYKGIEHSQGEKFFLWSQAETEKIGVKKQTSRSRRATKKNLSKKEGQV